MSGIRIRYTKPHQGLALIPCPHKPMTGGSLKKCPTCQTIHPFKTVHLWLNDVGECLVSEGVMADLREAAKPGDLTSIDLEVTGSVDDPPPLRLDRQTSRLQLDQQNRKITQWSAV